MGVVAGIVYVTWATANIAVTNKKGLIMKVHKAIIPIQVLPLDTKDFDRPIMFDIDRFVKVECGDTRIPRWAAHDNWPREGEVTRSWCKHCLAKKPEGSSHGC